MWVHAMRKYYYVSREVEPKRQQLAASEKELAGAVAMRDAAEAKLKAVNDRVAMLEQQLQASRRVPRRIAPRPACHPGRPSLAGGGGEDGVARGRSCAVQGAAGQRG